MGLLRAALGWKVIVAVWCVIFAVPLALGVSERVDIARRAAEPPLEAAAVARSLSRRIDRNPAAVGRWLVVERPPAWASRLADGMDAAAELYLRARGQEETALWVDRLRSARGVVRVVVVHAGDQGLTMPKPDRITPAVLCFPGARPHTWVPMFWDGPWSEDKAAAARELAKVCADHASLVFEDDVEV